MKTKASYCVAVSVFLLCVVSSSAQTASPQPAPGATPLQSLIQALSGKWQAEGPFRADGCNRQQGH